MTQYKYISKAYTLDELLAGNSIFKIYCHLFNNLYEWEINKEGELEVFDYINVNHLETVFNEFLNILSLFIYEKETYNSNINLLKTKSKNLEMFEELIYIIPQILYDLQVGYDSEVLDRIFRVKVNQENVNTEAENDDELLEIFANHLKSVKVFFENEEYKDLLNFFDIPRIQALNSIISNIQFLHYKPKTHDFNNLNLLRFIDVVPRVSLIFKDDHDKLFEFIVENYSGKKNNAFFSYLFHFFSDNDYLLKKAKSSIPYNFFLIENNFIDKFSKVIQRIRENCDEEKRMFEIFKKANDKFLNSNSKEN